MARSIASANLWRLVGDEFPTISRHLSVLKEAGVVADERRGKQVYCRFACPCVGTKFRCLTSRSR